MSPWVGQPLPRREDLPLLLVVEDIEQVRPHGTEYPISYVVDTPGVGSLHTRDAQPAVGPGD